MTRDYSTTLEIENPSVTCGHCRFEAMLGGTWTVEDGRLVFRADADPQPGRGPDLESCCESDPVVRFEHVTAGDRELTAAEITALRVAAGYARRHEFDAP